MSRVLDALKRYAEEYPDRIVLDSGKSSMSYRKLWTAVSALATELEQTGVRVLALMADNSPAWAVVDLASIKAGIPLIPVPHFFSPTQIGHLLSQAGVDTVMTDRPGAMSSLLKDLSIEPGLPVHSSVGIDRITIETPNRVLPDGCAKITFTSGSTGEPKGVCLTQSAMETVAASLTEMTGACRADRHLSLLPYATLLENIGGLYAPLLAGATIMTPAMADVGIRGASGLDVGRFVAALHRSAATTCIMIPQMLQALIAAVDQGLDSPSLLRYIAVGGATVSLHLLERAIAFGLPIYEGYGLSEAASVVAVNCKDDCRPGSVGRPLPHVSLRFAKDGEILVRGALFSGYLGDVSRGEADYWPTGDIGYLDDDGFLYLSGRKKHIFITAFGRNVSPEWVERELSIEPAIAQCCVFGEAQSFNVAVIVAREVADVSSGVAAMVQQAVDAANARLPDYARVSQWLVADEPFSVANTLWTGTGRPRRQHIFTTYAKQINQLHKEN